MQTILNLLLCVLTLAGPKCVHAGHPLWESPLQVKHAVPINVEGPAVTTWPAGRVRYTYPDIETQFQLMYPFRDAVNLWGMLGLPDTFQFVQIDREECSRNRRDCVVFERSTEAMEWVTVVGKYIGPTSEAIEGSFAMFDLNLDESPEEEMGKVCHQIGHILGLYHEHQNPYFWDRDLGGLGTYSLFEIRCENIMGFDEAIWGLDDDGIYGPAGVCTNRNAAIMHGFQGAVHILPITELNYLPHPIAPSYNDVDWKSVMIWSSANGGKLGVRRRSKTILKNIPLRQQPPPDFKPIIDSNYYPSAGDVQAIIQLYAAVDTRFEHRYFHDPHSQFFPRFNEMRNAAACDRDVR